MDYAVMKVVAMYQHWGNSSSFTYEERPWSGLMCLLDCSMSFHTGEGRTDAGRGSLCYIPQHCKYTATFSGCADNGGAPQDILINFLLFDEDLRPFRLSRKYRSSPHGTAAITPMLSGRSQACFPTAVSPPGGSKPFSTPC